MNDHHGVGQEAEEHRHRERYRPLALGGLVGLVAYAWWATSLRPFTWPSVVVVLATGVAAIAAGRLVPPRPAPPLPRPAGVAVWAGLAAALAAWELAAWLRHPRADNPTLSSLANDLLDWHPLRAAAFLAWVVATAALARR